jgi:VWFA-related protein
MSRVLTIIGSVSVAAAAVLGAQQPSFWAHVNTVSVYTTVSDRDGRLVPGLTKDDFEVFDNGKRQDLTHFVNEVQPITIVVMLDRSGSIVRSFDLVRDASEVFLENLLDGDRARIGQFGSRVEIAPANFTGDKSELTRILTDNLLTAGGATRLWDATAAAMTALSNQQGRRVVLVFTDGVDNPMSAGTHASFEQVRERSRAEGVMVYGIGLIQDCDEPAPTASADDIRLQARGRGGRGGGRGGQPPGTAGRGRGGRLPVPPIGRTPRLPDPARPGGDRFGRRPAPSCSPQKPDKDLKTLAAASGGAYFELNGTENLVETFARVAEELHQQYLLGFSATKLDGKVHTLEVRVRRPGMTARGTKSYTAPRGK